MLEKLGLPEKPSMRGAAWVIDASHCQGCSSQFTFINRKHHCRRCGGLFCNSCTHQRMILRGQGDSPVRICDPCKKLEDAARFELRYGHKNRAAKGNPKQVSKHEEEILGQILGTDGKQSLLSGHEAHADVFSGLRKAASSSSSSNLKEECTEVDILRSMSVGTHTDVPNEIQSCSPEELRKQAVEEKNRYKILKGEGKSEEALQAFKHSKELERQAGALEISLRKSRRMASKVPNLSSVSGTEKTDIHEESSSKKLPSRRGEKGEDDLANELRGLGWSDTDLHEADKKPANLTLEGELSNLLGEMPKKSSLGKGTGGIDNSQVIAHKKKALMFKREGKLAEAKEELKKAKILEKQLEEQELLGEDEDPDDELSALIHSMDDDKQDEFLLDRAPDRGINFDNLFVGTDDLAVDGNFEVTDVDMNDPDLAAALKSFGWAEEDDEHVADHVVRPARLDLEALQHEVLTLKRESLNQKRAGNTTEAMALLKKAKLLEKDLEGMRSGAQDFTPEFMPKTSTPSTADEENAREIKSSNAKLPPKSKLAIQKELLSLKKKALTLRREGRVQEAEEELKKGRVLEQQLEEMENAPKQPLNKGGRNLESAHVHEGDRGILDLGDDGVEAEADVTEQDLHDPALLSVLKNMGWNDDDNVESNMKNKTSKQVSQQSSHDTVLSVRPRKAMRSKAEIQKELLGVKRKALALRRQGKTEEAEEELERAKALENEMVEMEVSYNVISKEMESHDFESSIAKENPDSQKGAADDAQSTDSGLSSVIMSRIPMDEEVPAPGVPNMNSKRSYMTETRRANSSIPIPETLGFESQSSLNWGVHSEERSTDVVSILPQSGQSLTMVSLLSGSKRKITHPSTEDSTRKEGSDNQTFPPSNAPIQPEIQGGAKESTSSEHEILSHGTSSLPLVDISESATQELSSTHGLHAQKAEILARKRKAVALKREGKLVEAREELRQAKLLEKCLEDAEQAGVSSKSDSASTSESTPFMQESITIQAQKPLSGRDRFKLQQESLSHKRNALKLRREGKVAESEAEFELAKALESQLEELGTQDSSANSAMGKTGAIDEVIVEDVLDPQLMSALKSIGWGDTDISIQPSRKSEPKPNNDKGGNPNAEKAQLEEQVKAEKLRALNLKRAGKQAEALEALRSAKKLEKKLGLLAS